MHKLVINDGFDDQHRLVPTNDINLPIIKPLGIDGKEFFFKFYNGHYIHFVSQDKHIVDQDSVNVIT